MKLLELIINDLAINHALIAEPLLKTKVLASRIKNTNLLEWVNSELNGYLEDVVLPDYRVEYGILMGSYINNGMKFSKVQMPIPNIDKKFKELYTKIENRDSIEAISNLIGKNNLAFSISNDRKVLLEQELRNSGNPRLQILDLHIQTPINFFSNIISNVRSKLLDFALQMELEFGVEANISTLSNNNKTVNHIMNTTINNSGDGAIINNGDKNNIEATISFGKGDKDALRSMLLSEKIITSDIDQLLEIIDNVQPVSKNNFSPAVNGWIQNMMEKALNGSWQITLGAAGNILAEGLQRYYGI